MTKGGDLRLRHTQHFGRIRLRKPARFKHLIQSIGQEQLGLTLGGVWETQVSEYVSGPTDYRFSPISAFSLP